MGRQCDTTQNYQYRSTRNVELDGHEAVSEPTSNMREKESREHVPAHTLVHYTNYMACFDNWLKFRAEQYW